MPPTHNTIAKGNSAASKSYWREEDIKCLTNIQPYTGHLVTLPNADMIAPSHKGVFQLSTKLSETAREATVLPALKSSSLISLGQICNDKCTIILDKDKLVALKNNRVLHHYENKDVILRGHRNLQDGLWDIPITHDVAKHHITSDNFLVPPLHTLNTRHDQPYTSIDK